MAESNAKTDGRVIDGLSTLVSNCPVQPSLPSAEIRNLFEIAFVLNYSLFLQNISHTDVDFALGPESFQDLFELLERDGEEYSSASPLLPGCLGNSSDIFSETESNDMTKTIQSTDECSKIIKTSNSVLPILRSTVEKTTNASLGQAISLSNSVAVTDLASNPLKLRYPLESTYRPRYKSDYFPQNGIVRRPRYVSDAEENHYVTLIMPHEYNRDLKTEYVRIALITTSLGNHEHYYSPYKFQTNHNDMKVPDQNPIYLPVQTSNNSNSMKLQLVLIKSKLDQLYDAQPLKPFPDTTVTVASLINNEKLSAKELITKYQLDKSHIAFTLCTKLPDGSYDIHPETTVISSMITETTAKTPASASTKPKLAAKNQVKTISCPNSTTTMEPSSVEEFFTACARDDTIQNLIGTCTDAFPSTPNPLNIPNNDINKEIKQLGISIEDADRSEWDQYFPESVQSKNNTDVYITQQVIDNQGTLWHEQLAVDPEPLPSKPVPLSASVTTEVSHKPKDFTPKVRIVYPLEEDYKARYKSDYNSLNGKNRFPRYVTDALGNHYVSLEITPGTEGFIRADWVTTEYANNIRCLMPYLFQTEDKHNGRQYCNPVYIPIETDQSGHMMLHLVLIKSKQDELKGLSQLQLFPPREGSETFMKFTPVPPKNLIRCLQLDKSQLAFTLCLPNPDGQSCTPNWETTVYSTIMTEQSSESLKKPTVTCPKCSHSFEPTTKPIDDIGHEKAAKKRKK
ncbi:unnamed protein product [Adineta ricciae]|uniref:Uncharacterized protein n=1 Tax=Adineta ricciae TaxID=249248 RepID=A0A816BKS4_ADIRI|nr:unnamed protein product [Adineta ricciae]